MKKIVFLCLIFYYSCNLCAKPLKRGVFCIFRGDATICVRTEGRTPIFVISAPKKHIRKVSWSGYPLRDSPTRFEWTTWSSNRINLSLQPWNKISIFEHYIFTSYPKIYEF